MKHYTVKSKQEAWELANKLFPTDYMHDTYLSDKSGYPVYMSTSTEYRYVYTHISDLGVRLELITRMGEEDITIWIRPERTLEEIMTADGFHRNIIGVWVR